MSAVSDRLAAIHLADRVLVRPTGLAAVHPRPLAVVLPDRELSLRGEAPLGRGERPRFAIEQEVKHPLDPLHRLATLDD